MPAIDWILENLASLLVGLSVFVLAALAVVFSFETESEADALPRETAAPAPWRESATARKKTAHRQKNLDRKTLFVLYLQGKTSHRRNET